MKDRLIELLSTAGWNIFTDEHAKRQVADHLLISGVIVPPVKVGQTVWIIDDYDCEPYPLAVRVEGFKRDKISDWIILRYPLGMKYSPQISVDEIGKAVFFTEKEAEKALAERSGK